MDKKVQKQVISVLLFFVVPSSQAMSEQRFVSWRDSLQVFQSIERTKFVLSITNESEESLWFTRSDMGVGAEGFKLVYVERDKLKQLPRSRISTQDVVLLRIGIDPGKTMKVELPLGLLFSNLKAVKKLPYVIFYSLDLNLHRDENPFSGEEPLQTISLNGVITGHGDVISGN